MIHYLKSKPSNSGVQYKRLPERLGIEEGSNPSVKRGTGQAYGEPEKKKVIAGGKEKTGHEGDGNVHQVDEGNCSWLWRGYISQRSGIGSDVDRVKEKRRGEEEEKGRIKRKRRRGGPERMVMFGVRKKMEAVGL